MDSSSELLTWQQLTNCLSVFDHFWGLALKGLIFRTWFYVHTIAFKATGRGIALDYLREHFL